MTTKILAYLIKYAIKNYMFVLGINRLLLQTDMKALHLSDFIQQKVSTI